MTAKPMKVSAVALLCAASIPSSALAKAAADAAKVDAEAARFATEKEAAEKAAAEASRVAAQKAAAEAVQRAAEEVAQKAAEKAAQLAKKDKEKALRQRVYDNCIIDKMPTGATGSLAKAIERECSTISKSPSWFDKLKYD